MLHGPPSDESFPTIYAPSRRCITYRKSSATMTDPIRPLFVYYVWFTVVYQGKSLVAWEGAAHLSSLSPSPFSPGTYDRWLSMTYRWWDPQRERGWHADLHPRCRYRTFRGKIASLHCARSRYEMNCHQAIFLVAIWQDDTVICLGDTDRRCLWGALR